MDGRLLLPQNNSSNSNAKMSGWGDENKVGSHHRALYRPLWFASEVMSASAVVQWLGHYPLMLEVPGFPAEENLVYEHTGLRRVLKSGPAKNKIECRRHGRGRADDERGFPSSRKWGSGTSPEKFLTYWGF